MLSCDQNTIHFHLLETLCLLLYKFVPYTNDNETVNTAAVLILYQITLVLPKNMQKAGFLMTRLKIMLAVHITES